MSSDIRQSVLAGLRWLALARLTGQILSWVSTIVVIRILAREDYGLMAMAMLAVGLLELINEFGLGAALVQRERLERETIGQVFALQSLINFGLYGLLYVSAPLLADFFDEDRLTLLIRVLGLQFPLAIFNVVPRALLNRSMQFQRYSLVEVLRLLTGAGTMLGLALAGWGVWALVWSNLAALLAEVIGLQALTRCWVRPCFRLGGLRQAVIFGGTITLERVLWYSYSQSDQFIVGKVLGKEALGVYAVALNLATLPMQKLSGLLNQVGFAAYAQLNRDRTQVGHYVLKTAQLLSFIAFPVFFGISAVAPELVMVLLGDKWRQVTPALQLLSLIMPLRMLGSSITPALHGIGRPIISLYNLLSACLLMPTAFFIGSHWGLTGVCLGWLLAYPVQFMLLLNRTAPALSITPGAYLQALTGAGLAAAAMYGIVAATRYGLGALALPAPAVLVGLSVVGALSYLALMYGFRRQSMTEFLLLFQLSEKRG